MGDGWWIDGEEEEGWASGMEGEAVRDGFDEAGRRVVRARSAG